jgi:hypothetical protein
MPTTGTGRGVTSLFRLLGTICWYCLSKNDNSSFLSCGNQFEMVQYMYWRTMIWGGKLMEVLDNNCICEICSKQIEEEGRENPHICYDCETLQLYMKHIASLDILQMPCKTVSSVTLKRMNTRQLMSRLRHSYGDSPKNVDQIPFDVLYLDDFFEEYVVLYSMPSRFANLPKYGCTLTKLKQKGLAFLRYSGTCKEGSILKLDDGVEFHVWERPYLLRAQTVSDMNYGDRWEGSTLVEEGNKYGDTSRFYIIGYIDKSKG